MSEKYDPKEFAHKEFMRQLEESENGGDAPALVQEGDSDTEDIILEYLESDPDDDAEGDEQA